MHINAAHILVNTLEEAMKVKSMLDNGQEFHSLARTMSKCPSSATGGNLGFFVRGQMVKEFEDAAFSAKVGTVVGPIQTQFGYHLIKRLY